MGQFACACCGDIITGALGALLRHIRLFHADKSNFIIQCNLQDCQRTFRNFHTFRNHVYARHGVCDDDQPESLPTSEDSGPVSQAAGSDANEGVSSDNDADDNSEEDIAAPTPAGYLNTIQKAAATWILKVIAKLHFTVGQQLGTLSIYR